MKPLFPVVKTSRLILDELTLADAPSIVKYISNRNITDVTLNIPYPYTEKDALAWIYHADQCFKNESHFIFAIRKKTDKELIGCISLAWDKNHQRAELSYWLGEPFWGKGITTEASVALIDFGFNTLELKKITAHHFKKNPASGKVMQKCGMTQERYFKEHILKEGIFHDIVVYGIIR